MFVLFCFSSTRQTPSGLDSTTEKMKVIGYGLTGLRHHSPIGLTMLLTMVDTAVHLLETAGNGAMENVAIN